MDDNCLYKKVFKLRARKFNDDIEEGIKNLYDSPIFDLLRISIIFGLYETVMNMTFNSHTYSKGIWKKIVWARAWEVEDKDWYITSMFQKSLQKLNMTLGCAKYLSWYHISDAYPKLMRECETMARLVCGASNLKSNEYRYIGKFFMEKSCDMCDLAAYENVNHLVMACPATSFLRRPMFDLTNSDECKNLWCSIEPGICLEALLGGNPVMAPLHDMFPIWCKSMFWINKMYRMVMKARSGIG